MVNHGGRLMNIHSDGGVANDPRALVMDEQVKALLATPVSVADGALFLKLFIPPLFDGAYLAFRGDGEPIGVVSEEAAALLEKAGGEQIGALVADETGVPDPALLDSVNALIAAELLTPGPKQGEAYWIRPDTASQTRHAGPGAARFIRNFYNYFGGVFHDGSLLIDSHGDFLDAVARYFPRGARKDCIDLGCGSGHYTAALARLGHRVFAADISQTRLDATAQKQASPGEIVPILADVEDVPLPDSSLQFAMCNFVLEHVADPFQVIDQIVRLLEPGGEMLLAVPSFNIRDTLAFWLYGEAPSLNFEHLRSYGLVPGTHPWCAVTTDTLNHLQTRGVDVVQVEGVNILDGLWEPWLSEFQAFQARLGPAFSTTWPWNCLGRQTVIFARKR